eukprot:5844096-Prymnesium_polylepis.1
MNNRIYPAATVAWAFHFQDGSLCSGAATKPPPGSGFTKADGTRGYMAAAEGLHAAGEGKAVMEPGWEDVPVRPRGTPVRVILDMEARSLSFAIGGEPAQLAFTALPATVHPYFCSGDVEDNSLMVVSGAPRT